jgi:hypothetical protein
MDPPVASAQTDREQLIELLAGLKRKEISYVTFADARLDSSSDPTVGRIWFEFVEEVLDDLYPDRRIELSRETTGQVDRALLFLRTGGAYEWPNSPERRSMLSFAMLILPSVAITVLLVMKLFLPVTYLLVILLLSELIQGFRYRKKLKHWRELYDIQVWPFRTSSEYDRALVSACQDEFR